MTLMILLGIGLVLFSLSFVTNRRYGVLGLGLTAGLVLSQEVSKELADFLKYLDFPVEPLPFMTAAGMFLILAPALIMLFSGPKYTDKRYAIIGSVLFAIYGIVLLIAPLVSSMPSADRAAIQPLLTMLAMNTSLIITVGVVTAVLDVMHSQGKAPLGKKGKH
jgi:hypothetical protein